MEPSPDPRLRVTFLKQGPASAAQLLIKSDTELKDVINVAFRYKEMLRDLEICYDSDKGELSIDKSVTLYHCPKLPEDTSLVNKGDIRTSNTSLHRHVLSLGQDIIYMGKNGKTRTPKHIGMSIACHKMTHWKTLQGIDTAWADMQINANHVVIPSNISPGIFTHAAADNWNRATDALTGEHFDIVNMVLYQAKRSDLEGQFDCGEIIHNKEHKRSLRTRNTVTNQILNCPNLTGKVSGPIHLKNHLDSGWFSEFSEEHAEIQSVDKVWVFLRMCPTKLFQITFQKLLHNLCLGGQHFMQCSQLIQQFLPILDIARPFRHHHLILIQCTQFSRKHN